jgi:molybdopterin-containing oxidoreductase family iron-sulfur binding subunit
VLSLYDPDRSNAMRRKGAGAGWKAFEADWHRLTDNQNREGLGLVTGRVVSPTTLARINALRQRFPQLRWYRYEPVNDDGARSGARMAFGRVVTALPRWADADVVLVLDADPIGHGPDELRVARAYALRRHGDAKRQRVYAAEPVWTLTGATADVRAATYPAMVREIGRLVANELGANLGEPRLSNRTLGFAQAASRELRAARGRALVLTGEGQPPELHALCHWINAQLNAPIDYLPSSDPVENDHGAELLALASDLHSQRIETLIVADANPVYDAPDHLHIGEGIAQVPLSIHLGLYQDETAHRCTWHLPLSHPLESWGDGRALDGTVSIVQPLIQHLHQTCTTDEYLARLASETVSKAYALTRNTLRETANGDFETTWRSWLEEGMVADSAAQPTAVSASRIPSLPYSEANSGFVLSLSPDPSVWDGRFSNNAWLQECAKPFTREVWGNAVQISPADAERLAIADESTIKLTVGGRVITAPAIIVAGQADGVIGASWGQGRTHAGRIGTDVGVRFCEFGAVPFARILEGAQIATNAGSVPFRSLQAHTRLNGRAEDLFQIASLADLARAKKSEATPPSLLEIPQRGEYAWAMVVDTDACIGCNACVVACQAENNVPVVGPEEVSLGRDMHWLRVDSYERSHGYAVRRGFEPVPCMHCELAPCEPVCPVEASVHDHEGLNVQVYNRCIGTRFCEANCPYKVRRFNWFDYSGGQAYAGEGPALKAQHNPDVSARGRGVMEKCNYCLQRISRARKTAEKQDREIADGEMITACQAACPTRAIHFGNINDPNSDVSRTKRLPQHYVLLEELNTRPRTTYLKRIYNSDETA